MNTLKDRLKEARTDAQLSQGKLGKLAKCGQTTIASIENGRNQGSTVLARLADALGVEPLWLAEGKGPKRRGLEGAQVTALHTAASSDDPQPIPPGDNRLPIRRAMFKISAGVSGYEIEYEHGDSEPIFMARRWFKENHYRPDKLLAIRVSGRSMEPSLYDGDLVIVNTEDVTLKDGQVFAANYDGELVIKRLKREAGHWRLSSDNQDKIRFPDKRCSDGCGLIGRIVYKQSEHI